jgi:hypothetical protein
MLVLAIRIVEGMFIVGALWMRSGSGFDGNR